MLRSCGTGYDDPKTKRRIRIKEKCKPKNLNKSGLMRRRRSQDIGRIENCSHVCKVIFKSLVSRCRWYRSCDTSHRVRGRNRERLLKCRMALNRNRLMPCIPELLCRKSALTSIIHPLYRYRVVRCHKIHFLRQSAAQQALSEASRTGPMLRSGGTGCDDPKTKRRIRIKESVSLKHQ
jgi:hypothetical protein